MPFYRYIGRGPEGNRLEGKLEAPTAAAVASQLADRHIVPVSIVEEDVSRDLLAGANAYLVGRGQVTLDDLILFCRQMHTLSRAGVPIIRALNGLAETTRKMVIVEALKEVVEDLEAGRELSAALLRHPHVFPALLTGMVQVGEQTGTLDEAFLQVAGYLAKEKQTADSIRAALRYPTFVVVAMAVAIAVLSLLVIPTFEKLFSGLGAELPLPTRIILGVSHFAVAYWPYMALGGLALFFGLRSYGRTDKGRYRWGRLKLRLPIVGSLILRATLIRFSRSFAMGYRAGVPMVQSLIFTAKAVDNSFVGSKIDKIREGIERGDTLTNAARGTKLFTPLVLQMLSVGDETGAIDEMLLEVADYYEREVDYDLDNLTSAIEPVLTIFMGVLVLIMALGVFLPMWELSTVVR